MRVFLGIPIPGELAATLHDRIAPLRDMAPGVSWVPPENYHITMLFLGDIDEAETERAKRAIDSLSGVRDTAAALGNLGQFPPKGAPRVVYAGLGEGAEWCREVYRQLCNTHPEYESNRRYLPHITLGRAKRGRRSFLDFGGVDIPGERFALDEVVLYRSILHQGGAEYRRLYAKALSESAE